MRRGSIQAAAVALLLLIAVAFYGAVLAWRQPPAEEVPLDVSAPVQVPTAREMAECAAEPDSCRLHNPRLYRDVFEGD